MRKCIRKYLCLSLVLGCVVFLSLKGETLTIDVKGVVSAIPLAFPGLEGHEHGADMAKVISQDLQNSGVFKLLSVKGLQTPREVFYKPSFWEWQAVMGAVLIGALVEERDGNLVMGIRLYNVQSGAKLGEKLLQGPATHWRKLAHRAADAIYECLTGEPGYFNTQIVYVAEFGSFNKKTRHLAMADQDGFNARFYASNGRASVMPNCSPDGRKVVFSAYHGSHLRLHILDLETGQDRMLPVEGVIISPKFTHDGRRIIFCSAQGGTTSVYTCDLQGGTIQRLTSAKGSIEVSPSLSPDGRQMVFASDRAHKHPKLYVLPIQGGQPQCLSTAPGSYFAPAWSPDGQWITFIKRYKGDYYLGVIPFDGKRFMMESERLLVKDYMMDAPSWAPNSRRIIFAAQAGRAKPFYLYMVDLTGRSLQKLNVHRAGEGPHDANEPSWRMPIQPKSGK